MAVHRMILGRLCLIIAVTFLSAASSAAQQAATRKAPSEDAAAEGAGEQKPQGELDPVTAVQRGLRYVANQPLRYSDVLDSTGSVLAVDSDGEITKYVARMSDCRNCHSNLPQAGGMQGFFSNTAYYEWALTAQANQANQTNLKPIGAAVSKPDDLTAELLKIPADTSLVVHDICPAQQAAQVGLQKHDIVLELDGEPVPGIKALHEAIAQADTKAFDLTLLRKGQREQLRSQVDVVASNPAKRTYLIGIHLNEMVPTLRVQLGLDEDLGVAVKSVIEDSPAAAAGLQAGDVLLSGNAVDLRQSEDVIRVVSDSDGKPISFNVLRNAKRFVITVTPKPPEDVVAPKPQPETGTLLRQNSEQENERLKLYYWMNANQAGTSQAELTVQVRELSKQVAELAKILKRLESRLPDPDHSSQSDPESEPEK